MKKLLASSIAAIACLSSSIPSNAQLIPTGKNTQTNENGSINIEQAGQYRGTYQQTGINYASAMKVENGFIIRVKRLIKPGSDTAKEIAGNVPVVSTAANILTLGLFKRAMRPTGANMRATWLAINCNRGTFDVAGDGYGWQDMYNDAYAQAEDLYFQACEPAENPPYFQFKTASASTIKKTGFEGLSVFSDASFALSTQPEVDKVAEGESCDFKLSDYDCSWAKYLDANPTVKAWAAANPEMAQKEKAKLNASD